MSRAPLTLKLYALLVLGAAALAPDHDTGMWWVGLFMVCLGVLWVLSRSRFGWWVQVLALGAALAGVSGIWRSYGDEMQALRVFVPPVTLTALTVMLVAAAILLLLPSTRSYCSDRSDGPRSTVGIALGVVLMAWFPAAGLSVGSRLPSGGVTPETPNVMFVGHDSRAPSAFFVGGSGEQHCVVILEPRRRSRSCYHGRRVRVEGETEHVTVWALPKRIARVDVIYTRGETREARLLDGSDLANVFYTTEAPDDVRGIRGYDAYGDKVIGCRFC